MRRKKSGLENLVLVSQLGINVMTPVFLCLIASGWLDERFGTNLMLPGLLLGICSGSYSTYMFLKHRIEKEREEEEEDRVKERRL